MALDIIVAGMRTTEPTSRGGKNKGHEAPKIGIRRIMGTAWGIEGAGVSAMLIGAETLAIIDGRAGVDAHPLRNAQANITAREERMAR